MSFGPVTRFGDHSSDGYTDDLWCVDGTHLRAMEERIDGASVWSVNFAGPCDGSCKPASTPFDLAARVAKMREEKFHDGSVKVRKGKVVGFNGPAIGSTIFLDEDAQAILDAAVPIAGRKTSRWYAKRDSEGEVWCLCDPSDKLRACDRHVRVATEFSWWSGRGPSGVYKAHKVTVTPCDGSCALTPVELTDQMAAAIEAALARQVA